MYWYHHGMNAWGWFTMSIGTLLFWTVLVTVGVLLYRSLGRGSDRPHTPADASPERLLAERFARGEIDEEEYRRRLAVLRTDGPSLTKH